MIISIDKQKVCMHIVHLFPWSQVTAEKIDLERSVTREDLLQRAAEPTHIEGCI